jgi:hypothetical protein
MRRVVALTALFLTSGFLAAPALGTLGDDSQVDMESRSDALFPRGRQQAPTGTPTPTPSPSHANVVCTGNCDRSSSVTIDELLIGVNIALGTMALDLCTPFDSDCSGHVTIDELICGINNALSGCDSRCPTPQPTGTVTAVGTATIVPQGTHTQKPPATHTPALTAIPTATRPEPPSPAQTKTP